MLSKTAKIMEHTDAFMGHMYAAITALLGTVFFITWDTVEHIMRLLIGLGSIATAIMAVRHYYYKTKITKKLLKEDKVDKNE